MLQYALLTDKGDRQGNEDAIGCKVSKSGQEACFVLCDGLGGHGQGEVASDLVVNSVLEEYGTCHDNSDFLKVAFEIGQEKLLALQEERHARNEMKTTAVVLHIQEKHAQWGHVGDSRLYHFENGKLRQRTQDHSVPQMLVAAGEIKEKNIRNHPDRSRLLRVMGMEWNSPKYVLSDIVEKKGRQAFLLCSDGFWELIEEKTMQKYLKRAKTPQEWLDGMKEQVLKNGKKTDMDNFSAIAVFVEG